MNRLLLWLLWLLPLGVWGCASSEEEEYDNEVMLRARILFKNFSGAYAAADYRESARSATITVA